MTAEEIKDRYPLPAVVRNEGYEVNRAGFCRCVFHEERTASMRIYERGFHSFCCGAHGDVIDFIRHVHGLSFRDACLYLTGEAPGKPDGRSVALARMRRRDRQREKDALMLRLKRANLKVDFYRDAKRLALELLPPFSDAYCDAVAGFEMAVAEQDEILGLWKKQQSH